MQRYSFVLVSLAAVLFSGCEEEAPAPRLPPSGNPQSEVIVTFDDKGQGPATPEEFLIRNNETNAAADESNAPSDDKTAQESDAAKSSDGDKPAATDDATDADADPPADGDAADDQAAAADSADVVLVKLDLPNLMCPLCAEEVQIMLSKIDGVTDVSVDVDARSCQVKMTSAKTNFAEDVAKAAKVSGHFKDYKIQ